MPQQRDPCIVCQLPEQPTAQGSDIHSYRTQCERCGQYVWPIGTPPNGRAARQTKMSAYIREQNRAGIVPRFTPELISLVEARPIPRVTETALTILTYLCDTIRNTNPCDKKNDLELQAIAYASSWKDLQLPLEILHSEDYIRLGNGLQVLPKGFVKADELRNTRSSASAQGFVAMSFDPSMDDSYSHGFSIGVAAAGFTALRIDHKEHTNGTSDEIMAEIRKSRFIIADYTHQNNGVYFEAGFALGLGIPVIPTCRIDHLDKLHFDIRHINTLKWDTPDDLAVNLTRRIKAVIGEGPLARQTP